MESVSFFAAFAAGLLSFFSPCVISLVPSYISYITGITFKEHEKGGPSAQRLTLINSVFFVLGFSFVFIMLGAAISLAGQLLFDIKEYVRIGGGFLVIFLGLFIMGVFRVPAMERSFSVSPAAGRGGLFSSFITGAVFASGWTPCVGPILGSILILAGTSSSLTSGVLLLVVYCAGLAIPFIISSLMMNSLIAVLPRISKYMRYVTSVSGLLLVITGVLLVLNLFNSFSGI